MKLEEDKEYFGEIINKWKPEYKNAYVITGMQMGGAGINKRVGRVVQIRLEAGEFGSDNVLLRHVDDSLMQHSNQSFWLIPKKFKVYLDNCFKGVHLDDSDTFAYTLGGKFSEKGFIIDSPIKDGESTPMRDIKTAICGKLKERFADQ